MTAPISAPPSAPVVAQRPDKPSKVLPTERVRFEKQLDLLRAYAAVSGQANKVVNVEQVANVAKLNGSTVSLCNGFFVDVHFLDRSPSGGFIPSPEVMSFQRAHAWSPDTAATKLAPLLADTWFYQRLQPKLAMGPLDRTEAVHDLADAANAHKKYESQLYMLLDYLEAAGLIRRDGDTLRAAVGLLAHDTASPLSPSPSTSSPQNRDIRSSDSAASSESATVATAPTPGIHFNIDVSVDMAEIASWGPDRITAFFEGVAKVLAAKSGGERNPPKE
jgi:hypothetical protein